jgi:hypothetical protein
MPPEMQQEIPELFELLLRMYMKPALGEAGQEAVKAPARSLYDHFQTDVERDAASKGVEHFLGFARQFMLEHPPQLFLTAVQGFGVELARIGPVRLIPAVYDEAAGTMEPSHAVPVTTGFAGSKVIRTESFGVTGQQ